MLDVHVLVMRWTPQDWVAQCLSSIVEAMRTTPFPMALHVLPGVEGHIGRARASGYACGTHPYATYVDDDDFVLPHAFAVLAPAIQSGARAIYGREYLLQNGAMRMRTNRHNLQVHRRDALIDHAQWRGCPDIAQRCVPGIDVLEPGYVHRLLPNSQGRALARADHDEYKRAHAWLT